MYVNKMKINEVWYSKDQDIWTNALKEYRNRLECDNKSQLDIDYKFDKIKTYEIKHLSLSGFYSFIIEDYFEWKFNPRDYISFQDKFCDYYVEGKRLDKLNDLKDELFSFDVKNIKEGLEIVTKIHCMRVIAGSGLLSILFPEYYGTIDRFIIKSLRRIEDLPEHSRLLSINESNPSINDGILIIELMRNKAKELNRLFNTNTWRPRDIDKILWALREDSESLQNNKKENIIIQAEENKSFNEPSINITDDTISTLKYNFFYI